MIPAALAWVPPTSLARIDLIHPDPWPKRRHWKRRFVDRANLDRIARVLRPGAEFRFASDWADYVDWTLARLPDGRVNVPKLAQRRMGILTALAPESEGAATVDAEVLT